MSTDAGTPTPLVARDEKGTLVQFWTQEQIEAAILTYGADDIDCCIQNQGEHIIRLQAELEQERAAVEHFKKEMGEMGIPFATWLRRNQAAMRARDEELEAAKRLAADLQARLDGIKDAINRIPKYEVAQFFAGHCWDFDALIKFIASRALAAVGGQESAATECTCLTSESLCEYCRKKLSDAHDERTK